MALGLGIAWLFELNVVMQYSDTGFQEFVGTTLTGIGMGAIGSGWHEVLDALSSSAKNSRAAAKR